MKIIDLSFWYKWDVRRASQSPFHLSSLFVFNQTEICSVNIFGVEEVNGWSGGFGTEKLICQKQQTFSYLKQSSHCNLLLQFPWHNITQFWDLRRVNSNQALIRFRFSDQNMNRFHLVTSKSKIQKIQLDLLKFPTSNRTS